MVIIKNMEELLINTIEIISRLEATEYEDGISKTKYKEQCRKAKARITTLNYKDLQLIGGVDNVQIRVQKMYTMADVDIKPTDYIRYNGEEYQVINRYDAMDENGVHHHKYFIKLVSEKWNIT